MKIRTENRVLKQQSWKFRVSLCARQRKRPITENCTNKELIKIHRGCEEHKVCGAVENTLKLYFARLHVRENEKTTKHRYICIHYFNFGANNNRNVMC